MGALCVESLHQLHAFARVAYYSSMPAGAASGPLSGSTANRKDLGSFEGLISAFEIPREESQSGNSTSAEQARSNHLSGLLFCRAALG